jgi:hypothetical protein
MNSLTLIIQVDTSAMKLNDFFHAPEHRGGMTPGAGNINGLVFASFRNPDKTTIRL